jgi:ribosomal protein L11 methylase PrmA
MKASEIVEKLKNVLLSSEAEEVEVSEPTELGADYDEEKKMEEEEDEVKDEVKMMEGYVTKDEFDEKVAEIKAMYDKLMEKMATDEEMEKDVPEELAEEPQQEVKEELSAQEPAVEPIAHNPEVNVEKKHNIKLSQGRIRGTQDIVFNKLFNK